MNRTFIDMKTYFTSCLLIYNTVEPMRRQYSCTRANMSLHDEGFMHLNIRSELINYIKLNKVIRAVIFSLYCPTIEKARLLPIVVIQTVRSYCVNSSLHQMVRNLLEPHMWAFEWVNESQRLFPLAPDKWLSTVICTELCKTTVPTFCLFMLCERMRAEMTPGKF